MIILPILHIRKLRHRGLKFPCTTLQSYKVAESGSETRSTQVEPSEPAVFLPAVHPSIPPPSWSPQSRDKEEACRHRWCTSGGCSLREQQAWKHRKGTPTLEVGLVRKVSLGETLESGALKDEQEFARQMQQEGCFCTSTWRHIQRNACDSRIGLWAHLVIWKGLEVLAQE